MKFLLSILGMTNQCNLNCTYCDWEKDEYRTITAEEYENVKNYLQNIKKEVDIRHPELILVEYTGGETLLYPEIIRILLNVFSDKWVRINTNGINITQKLISVMKDHGKTFFAFSLDSHNLEGNYPRFQNNLKIYNTVINNFDLTVKSNIPIYLLCTINEFNIEYIPEFVRYLQEKYSDYIDNGMLAMPAHYVTNYEKENGTPSQKQNDTLRRFLLTTNSVLINKNYQHYLELIYFIEHRNRLTTCTIPEWSLSVHYRKNAIINGGQFISFGCGMRGIYDLGNFDSKSSYDINKYIKAAEDPYLLEKVLKCKSSSAFAYGCQEMCFTDWVCFDMILQGSISIDNASKWFCMFKDQKVINFVEKYQYEKQISERI